MATSGHFRWPRMASSQRPLTLRAQLDQPEASALLFQRPKLRLVGLSVRLARSKELVPQHGRAWNEAAIPGAV